MQDKPTLRELDFTQMELVGGGSSAEWAVSTGTATALVIGAATASGPLIAGAMAAGAIISAGAAIYYAVSNDEPVNAS